VYTSPPKQAKFLAEDAPYYVAQLSKARVLSRRKKRLLVSSFRNSWFPYLSLFLVCRSAKQMLAVSPPKQLPVSHPIYTHSSLLFVKNSAVPLSYS
jgi:hypothetical protein